MIITGSSRCADPRARPGRRAATGRRCEPGTQARPQRTRGRSTSELPHGGTVGFLVWGDPAFYDCTIRIVESVADAGVELELTVVPGISSVQLLAARHKIVAEPDRRPIHLTTGRRLVDGVLAGAGRRGGDAGRRSGLRGPGSIAIPILQIYWGAQLGLPDEALVAGRLGRGARLRSGPPAPSIRAARGWVMDTYLLRRAA